ncbi:MAG: hypothetical protein SGBAC_008479 [Bacillariaceae sp.]
MPATLALLRADSSGSSIVSIEEENSIVSVYREDDSANDCLDHNSRESFSFAADCSNKKSEPTAKNNESDHTANTTQYSLTLADDTNVVVESASVRGARSAFDKSVRGGRSPSIRNLRNSFEGSSRGGRNLLEDSVHSSTHNSFEGSIRGGRSPFEGSIRGGRRPFEGSVRGGRRSVEVRQASLHRRSADDALNADDVSDDSPKTLDFESMPFVGRHKEVSNLKACFERMIKIPSDSQAAIHIQTELVLIDGISGIGKSALALTLQKEVSGHSDGMFIVGKFDMNTSSEPYSGICKAFGDLCQKVMESSPENICTVQAGINEQLGGDVEVLLQLIPELKGLVSDSINDPSITDIVAGDIEITLKRLRFGFRVLMRVFSSVFSPLVLVLENLQWSDVSSLHVLEFLVSDRQNVNALMIVGCYRSDEGDENSLLHNKMMALQDMTEKYNFCMTKISVGAFGLNEIEQIISSVMPNPNVATTLGLAKICLKRTLGNPFFVLEFLKMLHHEGLVRYNAKAKIWIWDVDEVDAETMSTANVVVMLHNRLTKLPHQVQSLLQCAAYLESTFSESTIDLVWTTYGRRLVQNRIERTTALLEAITKEKILEKCGINEYRWVHDKLQEAALALTGKRRESFQLDIGRTLYYGLDKKQTEYELFTIVDLINSGNVLKHAEFAKANLRAAEKAKDLSAFQAALEYAAHGLSLLKEDKWSSERDLTLRLYTLAAEMEAILGNVDASNRYSGEVLSRTDLTPTETLPLKMAKASTIGSTDLKFDESVKAYLKFLEELGCRVTRARRLVPVQAIVKLTRIVKRAKALPPSFYDKLVPIEDPRQKAIASIFSKLVYYAFVAGDMFLFTLAVCRLAEMTLDHGINEFSAKSFASVAGVLIMTKEDFDSAMIFDNIAFSMLEKFRGMHACETTYIACGQGLSWVRPFEDLHMPMGNAVAEGLRDGDTEYAMWNLLSSKLTLPYSMGIPITLLLKACPSVRIQCEDASQALLAMAVQVMCQMLLNLQGSSGGNPFALEGEVFSVSKDEETNHIHLSFVHFAHTELALFNGYGYEAAADRAVRVGDEYQNLFPAFPWIMVELFHRAVPLFAAARRAKKPRKYRKYRNEARRLLKRTEKWFQAGNPNVEYYFLLLTAENLALEKKYAAAEEKFNDAVVAVSVTSHLHHLGLIHERYADFLIEVRSSQEIAKDHLVQAIEYYEDWGADMKVKELESRL